jgi:spore coat polysaccharide biosynthesis protein SpsF (cytidylyltransferase family)
VVIDMLDTTLEDERLKTIFKQAMLELVEERRDVLYDLFAEIIEDLALVQAIKEGADSEPVSREEIFEILAGAD